MITCTFEDLELAYDRLLMLSYDIDKVPDEIELSVMDGVLVIKVNSYVRKEVE